MRNTRHYINQIETIMNQAAGEDNEQAFSMAFSARDALYRKQKLAEECGDDEDARLERESELRMEARMLGEDSCWNY